MPIKVAMKAYPRLLSGLPLVFALASCVTTSTRSADSAVERVAITRDGKYVGATEREVVVSDSGRQIITRQIFPVRTEDAKPRTVVEEKIRTEDENRNTTRVRLVSSVGTVVSTTTANIDGSSAVVTRTSRSGTRETRIALPENIFFDNGAQLFRSWDPQKNAHLEFHSLDIRAPLVERVVYTLEESDTGKTLVRKSYLGSVLRSLSRKFYDRNGALIGSEQPMFGLNLVAGSADSDTPNDFELVNPVRSSSMKSPYRISQDARKGHMRYTFGLKSGVSFVPPETAEQRVEITPDGFVLNICKQCGPGLSDAPEYLENSLKSTFWLESDHPVLTEIAEKLANKNIDSAEKMKRLENWARLKMSDIDFAGHFSAADALSLGRGDCTEGAVVLAALGRAAGIPTKVASGIVYSREQYHGTSHSFAPHAWTLAYLDGQWTSLDMSLDGFDATHIALSVSDGDPGSIQSGHKLAALLKWNAMTQVKSREPVSKR